MNQFTDQDHKLFRKLKLTVTTNDSSTKAWAEALLEIDKMELWRIDNAKSMHQWAMEHSPHSYHTIATSLRRLQKKQNERLIQDTTGEAIIKNTNKKKTSESVEGQLIQLVNPNNGHSSPGIRLTPVRAPKTEDEMGTIIPDPILQIWERRHEIQHLAQMLSDVKCEIERHRKQEDPLFMKIDQSAIARLEQIHFVLVRAIPYCVCGQCEGRLELLPDKCCGACKSTGFMSAEEYKRLIPEEKQSIRKKGIELRRATRK